MKLNKVVFSVCLALALGSCVAPTLTSSATEAYIKTKAEEHKAGEFSTIRTYSIFNGPTINGLALELTGYKFGSAKNLVIAAGDGAPVPVRGNKKPSPGKITFVEISLAQAQSILDNHKALADKIKADKPTAYETIYHDFTVSQDIFMSFSRTQGTFDKQAAAFMHLWIAGNKYTISSELVVSKIEAFVKY